MKAAAGRIWAIARLTLLEASRRKVFGILILFAAAILSSMAFFPSVEPAGRLRLMEVWALRATSLFTAIVALFITGYSLPGDFENKRIYMLVTKPVSKSSIFLGKFLGLSILLAAFVGTMGGVTTLFIRVVQVCSGPSFPKPRALERHEADEFRAVNPVPKDDADDEKRFIVAQTDGALLWKFTGLRRSDFGETISLESRLSIGSPNDQYRASGNVILGARNSSGKRHQATEFLTTNEDREWILPADLVAADGSFEILFRCGDSDGFLGAGRPGAAIYLKPTLFEFAFARGMILLFFQSMTVLSLTLLASSFLSAPLSILLGILLYLIGSTHSYVKDGARDIDRSLDELHAGKKHVQTPAEIPPWFLQFSSFVSKPVLALVPDFDHFDYSKWLLKDRAVSARDLGAATWRVLPIILVLGALGMIIMIFKDFG